MELNAQNQQLKEEMRGVKARHKILLTEKTEL